MGLAVYKWIDLSVHKTASGGTQTLLEKVYKIGWEGVEKENSLVKDNILDRWDGKVSLNQLGQVTFDLLKLIFLTPVKWAYKVLAGCGSKAK